jgi:ATP-dependent helicase HrpB
MKTIIVTTIVELARANSCILVFLPGITDIANIQDDLDMVPASRAPLQIFVLHSLLPREEQEAAIIPASEGRCKVILATNIAETSITIPDASIVLDTGLRR